MARLLPGISCDAQTLVFAGRVLESGELSEYGVEAESTVQMMLSVRGGSDDDDDDDDDDAAGGEAAAEAKGDEPAKLFEDDNEKTELAVMYAGVVLNDCKADISEENINKLLSAAKVEGVASYYPKMFAEIVKGKDFDKLIESSVGSPGAGGGGGGGAAAGGAGAAEAKKEEKKEEEEDDGGFDFDSDEE